MMRIKISKDVSHQGKDDDRDPEGWEYSKLFTTKFHVKEKTFDMVRRRRWNRKLVSDVPVPITFTVYKVCISSTFNGNL